MIKSLSAFFRQSWRSIVAVATVLVVSVGLLVAANAAFHITEEEALKSQLKGVYKFNTAEKQHLDLRYLLNPEMGEMLYLYKTDDGTMIAWSRSAVAGYVGKAETIIAVGKDGIIKNMVVAAYNGDDVTATINANYLNTSYIGKNVNEISYFYMTDSIVAGGVNVSSGATSKMSMTSVSYSVNMSLFYLRSIGFVDGVGWNEQADYNAMFKDVLDKDYTSLQIDESVDLQNGNMLAVSKTADGDVAMYIKAKGSDVSFAAGGTVGDYDMVIIIDADDKITHFASIKHFVIEGYDFVTFDTTYKNKTVAEVYGSNESNFIQGEATATSKVIFRGFSIAAKYYTDADLTILAGGDE